MPMRTVLRTVLITADDFGWTDGQNAAVEKGAAAGTLTRASLLANGSAFAGAVAVARRHMQLGVGVHLTLCEGRPLSLPSRLGPLCRDDGAFHDGLGPLLRCYLAGRLPVAAVEKEWRTQIEKAAAELTLSHLDGHKHVHLLPPLFDLTVRLAREYGVPYLRIPAETTSQRVLSRAPSWAVLRGLSLRARRRLRAIGGNLRAPDHFFGFADSGAMTAERLAQTIRSARPGLTEIMLHPAAETAELSVLRTKYAWARRYRFSDELAALCHPSVAAALAAVMPQRSAQPALI